MSQKIKYTPEEVDRLIQAFLKLLLIKQPKETKEEILAHKFVGFTIAFYLENGEKEGILPITLGMSNPHMLKEYCEEFIRKKSVNYVA